jgi:ATP-dependent exoDNAse (exonuclease V) alpha subunit
MWSGKQDEALQSLVEEWGRDTASEPLKSRFVFAYTNADVHELNAALRQVRKEQGLLGTDCILKTADGELPFAENDRLQFTGTSARRDERRAGIVNGASGTIEHIEGNRITVRLDARPGSDARRVEFAAGTEPAEDRP